MKLSKFYKLDKDQEELDFVDISLEKDTPLFIDPYALSKRNDVWSSECHALVVDLFQNVISAIKKKENDRAKFLLAHLHEPNETRLGLSSKKPKGKGMGGKQSNDLYKRLSESEAAKTGFLKDIEDCQLIIPGINRDKISDMSTNIIKAHLALYTKEQCDLHGIETKKVACGPFWDPHNSKWTSGYFELPVHKGRKIILVPKAIVRYTLSYDYQDYYTHFVLNFLQEEHIHAGSSLVKTLKDGRKKVYKKDLREKYPLKKEFLYKFSRENPSVLETYKKTKGLDIAPLSSREIEKLNPEAIALQPYSHYEKLLRNIPTGKDGATDYHKAIKGILTAIFYPSLVYPKLEEEINEGRKRIDIVYSNADARGFFYRLGKQLPCPFIMFECKNYKADIANPELDQISGRFSPNRGQFGIIVCRKIDDKEKFFERCRDTAQEQRGHIFALDDKDILTLLKWRIADEANKIDKFLDSLHRKIVM